MSEDNTHDQEDARLDEMIADTVHKIVTQILVSATPAVFRLCYEKQVQMLSLLSKEDYYQTYLVYFQLTDAQRAKVHEAAQEISIEYLLNQIGLKNPELFAEIEVIAQEDAEDMPNVIDYLKLQYTFLVGVPLGIFGYLYEENIPPVPDLLAYVPVEELEGGRIRGAAAGAVESDG